MMLSLRTILFRSVIQSSCTRYFRSVNKDPGLGRRLKILPAEEMEEVEDFEDLETDFMEVHKTHKQHNMEMDAQKERVKYYIARQKYFKEKFPNFLTWHDKEQIRYLHRSDPEEWTIDRLSEGFPALPDTIFKIVKSSYSKKQSRITNHDASVQNNWKLFKERKLTNLPPDLEQHLNKFTNRALCFKPFVIPDQKANTVVVKSKPVKSDFSEIISSYNKLKTKPKNEEQKVYEAQVDTPAESKVKNKKSITLQELQSKIKADINTGSEIDAEDSQIIRIAELPKNTVKPAEIRLTKLTKNKYQSSTGIQHIKKEEKDFAHLQYPEKIRIPRSIFKKGATFKLNDCYYDADGEFLYRVPGMSQ